MGLSTEYLSSDPFAHIEVPPQLEESLARHRRHLAELVHLMETAGVSEDQIEHSVSSLVDSYKLELMAAIRSIKE
jgi:hypothetical protein